MTWGPDGRPAVLDGRGPGLLEFPGYTIPGLVDGNARGHGAGAAEGRERDGEKERAQWGGKRAKATGPRPRIFVYDLPTRMSTWQAFALGFANDFGCAPAGTPRTAIVSSGRLARLAGLPPPVKATCRQGHSGLTERALRHLLCVVLQEIPRVRADRDLATEPAQNGAPLLRLRHRVPRSPLAFR